MTTTAIVSHLDALEALLRLALERCMLWRLEIDERRADLPARPARCASIPEDRCALRNPDAAIDVGGMGGGPVVLACRGCGEVLSATSATE